MGKDGEGRTAAGRDFATLRAQSSAAALGAAVGTGAGSGGCETSLFSHTCLILFGDDGARKKKNKTISLVHLKTKPGRTEVSQCCPGGA